MFMVDCFYHVIGEIDTFVAEDFRFHIRYLNVNELLELLDEGTFFVYYTIRKTVKKVFWS